MKIEFYVPNPGELPGVTIYTMIHAKHPKSVLGSLLTMSFKPGLCLECQRRIPKSSPRYRIHGQFDSLDKINQTFSAQCCQACGETWYVLINQAKTRGYRSFIVHLGGLMEELRIATRKHIPGSHILQALFTRRAIP